MSYSLYIMLKDPSESLILRIAPATSSPNLVPSRSSWLIKIKKCSPYRTVTFVQRKISRHIERRASERSCHWRYRSESRHTMAREITAYYRAKCQYINSITNEKGLIFATGTLVSNSLTESHTMLRYLAPSVLEKQRISYLIALSANLLKFQQIGNSSLKEIDTRLNRRE